MSKMAIREIEDEVVPAPIIEILGVSRHVTR